MRCQPLRWEVLAEGTRRGRERKGNGPPATLFARRSAEDDFLCFGSISGLRFDPVQAVPFSSSGNCCAILPPLNIIVTNYSMKPNNTTSPSLSSRDI